MKKRIIRSISAMLCVAVLSGSIVYVTNYAKTEKKQNTDMSASEDFGSVSEAGLTNDETVYVFMDPKGNVKKAIVSGRIKKSNIEKELPFKVSVSYKLNGKNISPEELAKKSGRVDIRFDYETSVYETVEINGRPENIHIPFVMLTGLVLNNDVFTNIEVKNGQILSDGSRTAAIGAAFPELQSDLNIQADKLNIPDYFEVSADVKKFELTNTFTVASNEIFNGEIAKWDFSADELTSGLSELTDVSGLLSDGAEELYAGLCKLLENTDGLAKGADDLAEGFDILKNGAMDLEGGISELADGTQALSDGLCALDGQSSILNEGAKQVFDTMLGAANLQLAAVGIILPKLTVENYAETLNRMISTLGERRSRPLIALKTQLDAYNQFYIGVRQYTEGVSRAKSGAKSLTAGAGQLKAGSAELSGGIEKLHKGMVALKGGVPALTDGITQLRDGALQLSDGLNEFDEKGIQKLADAADDLNDLAARLEAVKAVSKKYVPFPEIFEDKEWHVRFVCRTDSITTKEQ